MPSRRGMIAYAVDDGGRLLDSIPVGVSKEE